MISTSTQNSQVSRRVAFSRLLLLLIELYLYIEHFWKQQPTKHTRNISKHTHTYTEKFTFKGAVRCDWFTALALALVPACVCVCIDGYTLCFSKSLCLYWTLSFFSMLQLYLIVSYNLILNTRCFCCWPYAVRTLTHASTDTVMTERVSRACFGQKWRMATGWQRERMRESERTAVYIIESYAGLPPCSNAFN